MSKSATLAGLALLLLAWMLSADVVAQRAKGEFRHYRDQAGRELRLPLTINRVYATSQIGVILLYTLTPERLAGWIMPLQAEEKAFIAPRYHHLPVLGGWAGKSSSANAEQIAQARPDVIFAIGPIDDMQKAQAERLQQQTGIPVVMLEAPLAGMDHTYQQLGDLLGVAERAASLARYCRETISDVQARLAGMVPEQRIRVYYAQGRNGLETDPKGSYHTQVLDLVQGDNVAAVPRPGAGYSRMQVSMEQVMGWDPELILAGYDKKSRDGLLDASLNPQWQQIRAVRQGRVYQIPAFPFDWFDRPPSVNRIIGVKWLANLLYPQRVPLDLPAEVRHFYQLFYHVTPTPAQLQALLAPAGHGGQAGWGPY